MSRKLKAPIAEPIPWDRLHTMFAALNSDQPISFEMRCDLHSALMRIYRQQLDAETKRGGQPGEHVWIQAWTLNGIVPTGRYPSIEAAAIAVCGPGCTVAEAKALERQHRKFVADGRLPKVEIPKRRAKRK